MASKWKRNRSENYESERKKMRKIIVLKTLILIRICKVLETELGLCQRSQQPEFKC